MYSAIVEIRVRHLESPHGKKNTHTHTNTHGGNYNAKISLTDEVSMISYGEQIILPIFITILLYPIQIGVLEQMHSSMVGEQSWSPSQLVDFSLY